MCWRRPLIEGKRCPDGTLIREDEHCGWQRLATPVDSGIFSLAVGGAANPCAANAEDGSSQRSFGCENISLVGLPQPRPNGNGSPRVGHLGVVQRFWNTAGTLCNGFTRREIDWVYRDL
jgi:hypothetical protein